MRKRVWLAGILAGSILLFACGRNEKDKAQEKKDDPAQNSQEQTPAANPGGNTRPRSGTAAGDSGKQSRAPGAGRCEHRLARLGRRAHGKPTPGLSGRPRGGDPSGRFLFL